MYAAVLPEATVETINLGSPIGKARNAGAISAVPPLPPSPIAPDTRPACVFTLEETEPALHSSPRRPDRDPAVRAHGPRHEGERRRRFRAAHRPRVIERSVVLTSTVVQVPPPARRSAATYANSSPFVSSVAIDVNGGRHGSHFRRPGFNEGSGRVEYAVRVRIRLQRADGQPRANRQPPTRGKNGRITRKMRIALARTRQFSPVRGMLFPERVEPPSTARKHSVEVKL